MQSLTVIAKRCIYAVILKNVSKKSSFSTLQPLSLGFLYWTTCISHHS